MAGDKDAGLVVLVVDDFADTRRMMKQFLELEGYRVAEAAGGEEVVEVALSERPHLILMDLSMPGIDGLTAARRVREEPGLCGTPVIIISALDTLEVRSEVVGAGYGYVPKPFDFDQLKTLIGSILKKPTAHARR